MKMHISSNFTNNIVPMGLMFKCNNAATITACLWHLVLLSWKAAARNLVEALRYE